MIFWYLLLFVSPLFYAFSGINVNMGLLLIGALFAGYQLVVNYNNRSNWLLIAVVLIPIIIGAILGYSRGYPLSDIVKGSMHYLKPLLFMVLGHFYLKESAFNNMVRWLVLYLFIGTLIFYANPGVFIEMAGLRSLSGQGLAHFLAFNGTFLRNGSLLLSPLDTGFVLFFCVCWLCGHQDKGRYMTLIGALGFGLILSTATRSAIIGCVIAMIFIGWGHLTVKQRKIAFGILAFILMGSGLILGSKIISLFSDGSARLHFQNFSDALEIAKLKPQGYGIGFSGWVGQSRGSDFFYSEGSIITTYLELGILGLLSVLGYGYLAFKFSCKILFPVFVGFMFASLLIPIGFSTLFGACFFTALGFSIPRNKYAGLQNVRQK